jgi:uncharacterized membrane protein
MVGLDTAELINLIFVALLVGNDVAVWSVVHPALDSIPVEQGFAAERAMLLRYKAQVPILILLILASGIAVAVQDKLGSLSFWLSVTGCVFIFLWQVVVISLYPLNIKVMEADPEDVPSEADWRALRRTWYERHTSRTVLSIGALVVFVLSALRI